jgi:hypothetical protein
MRISVASEPGSADVPNEDWAGAVPGMVVVLDGVTSVTGGGACRHGTPWFVRELGTRLLTAAGLPRVPLSGVLATAISQVAQLHGGLCDLASIDAPSAAVAMLRTGPEVAEWLVLADATVVLNTPDGVTVVTDDRVAASVADVPRRGAGTGTLIAERRAVYRNRPGGYWVAAADPEAARNAVCGSVPAGGLTRALVLTDGAARLADMFGGMWEGVIGMWPDDVIREVRETESGDPGCVRWPRFKVCDDATAVAWTR